jgi:hypothetical protein
MIKEQLSYQTRCRRRENIHHDFNQFDVIRLGLNPAKKPLPQMTRAYHLSLSFSKGMRVRLFAGETAKREKND